MIEEWRDIPGIPDYQASNAGNIRSVDRIVFRTSKAGVVTFQPLKAKILSPSACKNGYLYVSIRGRSYQVHRLVAMAWVDGFDPALDAAHSNNDRHDNVPSNLMWKTRLENIADQIVHGTRLRGERQNGAVLTEAQVLKMRETYAAGGSSYRLLGEEYGVHVQTVAQVIRGESWQHLLPASSESRQP